MKKIKKLMIQIITLVGIMLLTSINYGQVKAAITENLLQEQLEYYARNIEASNITKEDILNIYDEISEQYTNEEIADMIEENAQEIERQGISKEIIEAGSNFIRTTDQESIRNIIENDIDVEEIKEKVKQGDTPEQIVKSVVVETPHEKKIEIALKLLLANKVVKQILVIILVLFIYGTILRWRIYAKAGKPGWAAIIPFYRQIVMYQVCGLSPWLMLLWLVPIIGWLVMFIIAIMKRFCLADKFGKGSLFGFGLLILAPIFQTILAFQPGIEKIEKD